MQSAPDPPRVGLILWGDVIDSLLDQLGIDIDAFRDASGGWFWNYFEALRGVGVGSVLFAVSARVRAPLRFVNQPTGARVCILPAPLAYRGLQRLGPPGRARLAVRPYLATPPRLLARELRRAGCTALICQEYENPRFDACVLLGRLLGLPVFATFQGGTRQRSRLEAPIRPLALRACAGLIIGPRAEPPTRIARIFNPVAVPADRLDRAAARAALGIPPEARVVVSHGRVEYAKGPDLLIEAWAHVRRQRPDQDRRLVLVGTGRFAPELRARLARMPVDGVCWVDRYVLDRAEIERYLCAADVYALSARSHEGFPVAPLEAMACGLPVVATDVSGVPDILEGGETAGGLMVPRGDLPALASTLAGLLDDVPRARRIGERARQRIESAFTLGVVGQQLRALLFPRLTT
jgi:glycosyltransferase involved in cell wall biosynthesis